MLTRFYLFCLTVLLTMSVANAQIDPRLLAAIRQNNPARVEAALRADLTRPGANPNATDSLGATPLMWACYQADTNVVKVLVKAGANTQCRGVIRTDSTTYYGNLTGLASGLNKLPLLRYLLETLKLPINEPEYNPDTQKNDGWTPVEWAAAHGHLAVLTYLAERGASLAIGKGNPLVLAVNNQQTAVVDFLLERGLVLNKTHPRYTQGWATYYYKLKSITQAFEQTGRYRLAALGYEQLCDIYGEKVSKEDKTYANLLHNLAGLYKAMEQYERSQPLYLECKTIRERLLGTTHPDYTTTLTNLALLHESMRQYEKALPLQLEINDIIAKVLGKKHPDYATVMGNLAGLYLSMGQHERALPLYLDCITIREQAQSKSHPDYGISVHNLARLYWVMGQYEKAIPLYLEALAIVQRTKGKMHPHYVMTLTQLASVYKEMNQYEKALPLYLDYKRVCEQALGKTHPDYANALNSLAALYRSIGQGNKALPLYLEALVLTEKQKGKMNSQYAAILNNLGGLYSQNEKALPLYEESKAITEQVLGKNHLAYANSLHNLAGVYHSMGYYEKALPMYLEALSITEKAEGKTYFRALTLNNLAGLYGSMGQYEKSLTLLLEAKDIITQAKGITHSLNSIPLESLAKLYQAMNQPKPIAPLITQIAAIYRQRIFDDIAVLDEKALQQYQHSFNKVELSLSMAHWTRDAKLAGVAYNQSLLDKGAGLLAYQQMERLQRISTDSTVKRLSSRRAALRHQLRQLYNANAGIDKTTPLINQVQELQQALVVRLPDYRQAFEALRVEWPQVQKALKADEAAIEFVHFRYWHNRWTDSTFYAAIVLRPGWSAPRFVVMTEAGALDTLVALKTHEKRKTAYVERLYTVEDRGGVVSGADAKPQPALYPLIWKPIDSLLTGVKRVYYAPAGMLHRLNLAALPINARQRVGEKYTLTLLASTRQIALPPLPRSGNRRALLLGGIQYERDSVAYRQANTHFRHASPTDRDVAQYDTTNRGDTWHELINTGPEIASVRATLAQQGYQSDTLTGLRASEEAFYTLTQQQGGSPNVLHIATHGFFHEAPRSTTATRMNEPGGTLFTQSKEALVRSGLVLAGGNAAWQRGQVPLDQEDGIMTAYEVSLLPLNQTELVVLSACETGLGDLRGSEGVYGLQRAFKMAGVQNVLMSLWQVPDKATRVLLETFYRQYVQPGQTVRSAFDAAVGQVRELYSEPYFWAGFVLVE